jgi:hypothetical protein
MKRINYLLAAAGVALCCMAQAYAAPKVKAQSPSDEAEATLEQIGVWSATVSDTAFQLNEMALQQMDPLGQIEDLDTMKIDINSIGKDLQALDAERDSLAAWETKALDQVLPLMQDAARNAQKATLIYNSDRQRLWATPYLDDTERVSRDTEKVATLLHDYLKLEKTQAKELQIEQDLGKRPAE